MGRPIEIARFELSTTELRELAARTQAGAASRWQWHWCWRAIHAGGGAAGRHGSADTA